MSFEDWYHADKNDPNGRSSTRAGAETGMAIGSLFGPAGAGIGAIAGAGFGSIFSSNGARKRARREATNNAYAFGKELFTYAGETKAQLEKEYEQNLSLMESRVAATGASMNDALRIQKGKLVKTRDVQLENLNLEVENFREGPNYEWLRNDYERVTGVNSVSRGSDKNANKVTTYSIGGESRSRGPDGQKYTAYTDAQKSKMRSIEIGQTNANDFSGNERKKIYEEYASRIAPSLEMYEKRVFGDEAAVKEYNSYVDARIKSANEWYDTAVQQESASAAAQKAKQEQQDQRGR